MKKQTHYIQDKGQIAIEFPDKVYMGSFYQDSKFEARSENDGLFIKLVGAGDEKREVEIHLHHHLIADILSDWAESLHEQPIIDKSHRETLREALDKLGKALKPT